MAVVLVLLTPCGPGGGASGPTPLGRGRRRGLLPCLLTLCRNTGRPSTQQGKETLEQELKNQANAPVNAAAFTGGICE